MFELVRKREREPKKRGAKDVQRMYKLDDVLFIFMFHDIIQWSITFYDCPALFVS